MIIHRVGIFFILVGGFTAFLGVLAIQLAAPNGATYFLAGLGALVLGVWMWWHGPKPEKTESGRFRIIKQAAKKNGGQKRGNLSYNSASDSPSNRDNGRSN
jgi:hypothetical protein